MAELARLTALEERAAPDPSDPDALAARLWTCAAPRLNAAYIAGAGAARAAVASDERERAALPQHWAPDDTGEPAFDKSFDIPPAAVWALRTAVLAGTDPRLVPPASVREARLRSDYRATNGWHGAITKRSGA